MRWKIFVTLRQGEVLEFVLYEQSNKTNMRSMIRTSWSAGAADQPSVRKVLVVLDLILEYT